MPSSDDADFAAAADALYAVPAAGFIAERNARAKAARGAGDRDLAARISALPKPSAAAGLVNLVVRDAGDDLERVLALGDELRAAQEDADRGRLRDLGAERRDLLAEVAAHAADLAQSQGHAASGAVLEELQQTLQAALADRDAATAVRTGRLVRTLKADGLDPVDLANAVGGPGAAAAARTPAAARPDRSADDTESTRREAAERQAAEAEQRAADARRAADDAAVRADEAAADAQHRRATADDLRDRLTELQEEVGAAEQALEAAQHALDQARDAAADAARAADAAEHEAAALRDAAG